MKATLRVTGQGRFGEVGPELRTSAALAVVHELTKHYKNFNIGTVNGTDSDLEVTVSEWRIGFGTLEVFTGLLRAETKPMCVTILQAEMVSTRRTVLATTPSSPQLPAA